MRSAALVLVLCSLLGAGALYELGHLPAKPLGWLVLPVIGAALLALEGVGEGAVRKLRRRVTPLGIFVGAMMAGAVAIVFVLGNR